MAPNTLKKTIAKDSEQPIEEKDQVTQECTDMILSLPREKGMEFPYIYLYQNFWCPSFIIQGVITFQKLFQAKDTDVIIATNPKSGTTWLKALTFSIVNRHCFPSLKNHPLLTSNSHHLVPFLESMFNHGTHDKVPDLSNIHEPRLFGIHTPFPSLPNSIKESNCKIIYICRNPFDTFISTWIFQNKIKAESLPTLTLEEAFERYCKGQVDFGPFWSHMLGYWKESIANPNRILFLKYEDLKKDINFHVRRIAEFLDCPFAPEEESNGEIENIINLCSFEKMKELEVNKTRTANSKAKTKHLFRKGEIGDWKNYFSPSMIEKLAKLIEDKLNGHDLTFDI